MQQINHRKGSLQLAQETTKREMAQLLSNNMDEQSPKLGN